MITIDDILSARENIRDKVFKTPTFFSDSLSGLLGHEVYLKLECHQQTGSFKLRGACNAVLQLNEAEKQKGVVCVSTGNHGRGLAFAARQNGIKAVICMGNLVPQNKIDGIRALGGEVRIVGTNQEDAEKEADRLVREAGMTMVPPFDHPDIISGQGTVALEILEQVPDVETVVTPLSGGGLCGGVSFALKSLRPQVHTVGVTMERGAAMYLSIRAGKPVAVDENPTLADSLGGGIGADNAYTLELNSKYVDSTLLVSESEIAGALRHAYFEVRQVIEGGAAVGIAAALHGKLADAGKTVIVVSGKNINMDIHQLIMNGSMPDHIEP